jgi:hypothetical protein
VSARAGSIGAPSRLFGWAVASALVGCGGGLPLLHPAQTLPEGEVRASAGFSGNIAVGDLSDALRAANQEAAASPGGQGPAAADITYARGALVAASVAPGLAPVIAARVGVGKGFEAGVGYTGRSARLDVRKAFGVAPHWAFSVGAAGSAVLYGRQTGEELPDVDLTQAHGWGADVPVLVGYESDGGLYTVWVGARAGWEQVDVGQVSSVPGPSTVSLSATRFWGGGLVGLAAGFRHVHVALEADVSYMNVAGDFAGVHATVAGAAITPATALWWDF